MTRKALIALAAGAAGAVLVTGTALAVTADDPSRAAQTTPSAGAGTTTAVTTAPMPPASADEIGIADAIAIAQTRAAGGSVVEVERDWEHGRPVWEVKIVHNGVEYEIDVDRQTGDVVKLERDDDAGHHHGHDD